MIHLICNVIVLTCLIADTILVTAYERKQQRQEELIKFYKEREIKQENFYKYRNSPMSNEFKYTIIDFYSTEKK